MDGAQVPSGDLTGVSLGVDARQLLTNANEESANLLHEYIGTEHLVLALSRSASDASLLAALALEPERVRARIGEVLQRGSVALAPELTRPYTSRTMRAFTLAIDSARELGHTQLGAAHLLVGLLREQTSIGARVLIAEGLTEERAYEHARRLGE